MSAKILGEYVATVVERVEKTITEMEEKVEVDVSGGGDVKRTIHLRNLGKSRKAKVEVQYREESNGSENVKWHILVSITGIVEEKPQYYNHFYVRGGIPLEITNAVTWILTGRMISAKEVSSSAQATTKGEAGGTLTLLTAEDLARMRREEEAEEERESKLLENESGRDETTEKPNRQRNVKNADRRTK